jgi:hypothetical protein
MALMLGTRAKQRFVAPLSNKGCNEAAAAAPSRRFSTSKAPRHSHTEKRRAF